jgi:hypothetical protein
MPEIQNKSLEELEQEDGEVMNDPIITALSQLPRGNTGKPFNEAVVKERALLDAPEARKIMESVHKN